MIRYLSRCVLSPLMIGCLSAATLSPASAIVVFDDHFDGNSGGMPAGWWLGHGSEEDVVESGSIVTLYDWVSIHSEATIDPSNGTVRMQAQIAGTGPEGKPHPGYANHVTSGRCGFILTPAIGEIRMCVADTEGSEQFYTVGNVPGYSGGPIQVTLILEETAFRVLTDLPPFDSGLIDYTSAFPTFTRADLGTAVHLYLMDDVAPEESGFAAFDRITVEVDPPTAVESTTFGRIKALFRR